MSAIAHPRGRASARRRGYTLVEVMMALSILAVGATGILALQKTAIVGNLNARRLVTANLVASTWMERLRTDAVMWNREDLPTAPEDFSEAALLDVGNGVWVNPHTNPAAVALGWNAKADLMGRDISGAPTEVAFCTHYRVTEIYDQNMLRLEVRTFWSRTHQPIDAECEDPATNFDPLTAHVDYGFVFVTSAVRRTDLPEL